MEKKWLMREYTDEDKENVFDLRRAVYNGPFNYDEWDWKFQSSKILVAVNDKDEVVSLRPTVKIKLKFKDKILTAGMNVDVMTHPDYQRMGIFSSLVDESFKKLNEEKIHIVYTFPNNFSFPGYQKRIKWNHVASIPLLVKVINPKNVVNYYITNSYVQKCINPLASTFNRMLSKNNKHNVKNLLIEEVTFFDKDYDRLWQELSNQFEIAVVRDSNYLNWRYLERPDYNYKAFSARRDGNLTGYIVLREDNLFNFKLGLIVDIISKDTETFNLLISHAYEIFKDKNIDIMGCLMLNTSSYFNELKKAGFINLPKKFTPKEFYFVVKADEDIISKDEVYSSKNWFLTFGDIDIA